jgi:hypothetical protein
MALQGIPAISHYSPGALAPGPLPIANDRLRARLYADVLDRHGVIAAGT